MSVSHCTPDYYATLLVLFKKHRCELGLSEFATEHLFGGSQIDGFGDSSRISESIIKKMIVANSLNYCQRYPEQTEYLIPDEESAGDYLQYGTVNKEYVQLSKSKVELLAQAIYYWLNNTEDSQGKTDIYKMMLDCGRKYSFWAATKQMPYVCGIPSSGMEIDVMPRMYKG